MARGRPRRDQDPAPGRGRRRRVLRDVHQAARGARARGPGGAVLPARLRRPRARRVLRTGQGRARRSDPRRRQRRHRLGPVKPDAAVELGHQLERAGYRVDVVDVEVPYDVSAARIAQRWRGAYTKALQGDPEYRHGGRWVPEDYARSVYAGEGSRAISQESAERVAHECGNVTSFRRFWTPGSDRPRVVEVDQVRGPNGGLVDRRAADATRNARASFPAAPQVRPAHPGRRPGQSTPER